MRVLTICLVCLWSNAALASDMDGDGVPDGEDVCPGMDDHADGDLDGVPDGCDICPGHDDALDSDGDGMPDGCDGYVAPVVTLTVSGACPGPMFVEMGGMSPGGPVALVTASGEGEVAIPAGPCAGTGLGLTADGLGLRGIFWADPIGGLSLTTGIGAAACGKAIQAVDVATCTVSHAAVL
jgi:hypothetical protein